MGWRHFLTLVVILSGVVACGPGPFINPFYFFGQDEAENSKPVPKAKPSDGYSCEQDKSIGPDRVRLKETITIERQFKKFISYDCEGKEVGSGWQTIKTPN